VDEKEFHEIKEQASRDCWDMTHVNQRLSRKRYWAVTLNLIENTVPVLVAKVEELRVEQEQMRGEIKSLKDECSALITESDEHLRELEEFQAVVQEALNDVSETVGSFNKCESPDQLDLALSVSTVGHSDGRQVRDDENTGFLVYQQTDPAKPRPKRVRALRELTRASH
jgi:chromosome segregation ATPase